jgi:conjugative relaxase-like TrwC/TraI family protein
MLTIGKLGKGQEAYYLDTVATGIEDYYAGAGEAPGRWRGAGAAELGLEGEVERHELKAVLAGEHPRSGERLPRRLWTKRIPGFDLTFSAPKSVSVLWATGDERTAAAIRDAHERSVRAALTYLEREAAVSRIGAARRAAHGSGFVGAAFRHRMSRAGDPQLHTHVLVANLVRTEDGEWRALDAQMLYRRAKTAGYLYQANLRHELTRTLGLEWREVHRGAAEIAGRPGRDATRLLASPGRDRGAGEGDGRGIQALTRAGRAHEPQGEGLPRRRQGHGRRVACQGARDRL